MKKLLAIAAVATLSVPGCMTLGGVSGGPYVHDGYIATVVKGPLTATSNVGVSKTGTACSHNLFGIVAWGDSSITAAKSNGGITKVAQVDFDRFGVLGIYGKVCTLAKGE